MEKSYTFIDAIRSLGQEKIASMLPTPLKLYVSDHSTGCQIRIEATIDGQCLLVWQSSQWYSHIYNFNDEGKTMGLQPKFDFMKPMLDGFFEKCRLAWGDKARESKIERLRQQKDRSDAEASAIEKLRIGVAS